MDLSQDARFDVRLRDEVQGVDLGDERLNKRLEKIINAFGNAPQLSTPAALQTRAELEAA